MTDARSLRLALLQGGGRKVSMTLEMLEELLEDRSAQVHVSIFLPTHPSDTEGRQDAVRLKNLLKRAEQELRRRGHRRRQIDEMLATAHGWLNDAEVWKHQGKGLAVFITERGTKRFRLDVDVEELCIVGDHFHVAPLVSQATGNGTFHVLAISQNQVRLYRASRDDIEEVELTEVPRSINDALGHELRKDTLQWHTRTPPSVGLHGGAPRRAMFFGQGAGADDADPEQRHFLQIVDRALLDELDTEARNLPMVVAAASKTAALYHQMSRYPRLIGGWSHGNPDAMDARTLHQRAWALAEPFFDTEREAALELFPQMEDAGRATTDLAEILRAAEEGRVGTLMIAKGVHRWGDVDESERTVTIHDPPRPGDEDLVERAVVTSLRRGAVVHVQPPDAMPKQSAVAALYRF